MVARISKTYCKNCIEMNNICINVNGHESSFLGVYRFFKKANNIRNNNKVSIAEFSVFLKENNIILNKEDILLSLYFIK